MIVWTIGRWRHLHAMEDKPFSDALCGAPLVGSRTVYPQKFLAIKEQRPRGICHKCLALTEKPK